MDTHFFVDIHCHPSMKPYARSFEQTPGDQPMDPGNKASMWDRDAPSLFDKIKNMLVSLTNFKQSDATSLLQGRVCVVCLSFYPQEKGFFINRAGQGIVSDALTALATEFGKRRIDHLQQLDSYWNDLKKEMDFLIQGENRKIVLDGREVTYSIARSFDDINLAQRENVLGDTLVIFVPTIEGCHVFDQVMDCYEPWNKFPGGVPDDKLAVTLDRIKKLREGIDGYLKPAFVTFAHHFWNGLCGHARSLTGLVKCIVDQENGLGTGFTPAGVAAANALLKPMTNAAGVAIPPIYIDIKHMSRKSREDYFSLLDSEYAGQNIPVFVSHAGVTGLSKPHGDRNTPAAKEGLFNPDDINFYDDEILRIELANGVLGIQLDERRIGSKQAVRGAKGHSAKRKILYAWAKLVWNQVRHIAELLDMNGRFAWGIQTLGTDYDGVIDPINGYWTSKELDDLDDYLLKHAFNYLNEIEAECPLLQAANRNISPEEVVDRVMTGNAIAFLSSIYK
jgi:hypothetical protein